jgi:hypothetical protein
MRECCWPGQSGQVAMAWGIGGKNQTTARTRPLALRLLRSCLGVAPVLGAGISLYACAAPASFESPREALFVNELLAANFSPVGKYVTRGIPRPIQVQIVPRHNLACFDHDEERELKSKFSFWLMAFSRGAAVESGCQMPELLKVDKIEIDFYSNGWKKNNTIAKDYETIVFRNKRCSISKSHRLAKNMSQIDVYRARIDIEKPSLDGRTSYDNIRRLLWYNPLDKQVLSAKLCISRMFASYLGLAAVSKMDDDHMLSAFDHPTKEITKFTRGTIFKTSLDIYNKYHDKYDLPNITKREFIELIRSDGAYKRQSSF